MVVPGFLVLPLAPLPWLLLLPDSPSLTLHCLPMTLGAGLMDPATGCLGWTLHGAVSMGLLALYSGRRGVSTMQGGKGVSQHNVACWMQGCWHSAAGDTYTVCSLCSLLPGEMCCPCGVWSGEPEAG